jgi:transcriptional regulator with XRE-family HTH domain
VEIYSKDIKARLKLLIKNKPEINQKVIAARIGVSTSHMSQILDDKRRGDFNLLSKIAAEVGTSIVEIIQDFEKTDKNIGIAEENQPYITEIDDLLNKARAVLESDTHWSVSLKSNINSFHKGLTNEQESRGNGHRPNKNNTKINRAG